jgi:hypothetical protein
MSVHSRSIREIPSTIRQASRMGLDPIEFFLAIENAFELDIPDDELVKRLQQKQTLAR